MRDMPTTKGKLPKWVIGGDMFLCFVQITNGVEIVSFLNALLLGEFRSRCISDLEAKKCCPPSW
jgi:hypothetical protein